MLKKKFMSIVCILMMLTGCMEVEEEMEVAPVEESIPQKMPVYQMELLAIDEEKMLEESDKAAGQETPSEWELESLPDCDIYTAKGREAVFGKEEDGAVISFGYYPEDFSEISTYVSYYPEKNRTGADRISGLDRESAVEASKKFLSSIGIGDVQLGACVAIDKNFIKKKRGSGEKKRKITSADEAYYMSFYVMTPNGSYVSNRIVNSGDSDTSGRPPVVLIYWGEQGLKEVDISNIRQVQSEKMEELACSQPEAERKAGIYYSQQKSGKSGEDKEVPGTFCYISYPVSSDVHGNGFDVEIEYRPAWLFSSGGDQETIIVDAVTGEVHSS